MPKWREERHAGNLKHIRPSYNPSSIEIPGTERKQRGFPHWLIHPESSWSWMNLERMREFQPHGVRVELHHCNVRNYSKEISNNLTKKHPWFPINCTHINELLFSICATLFFVREVEISMRTCQLVELKVRCLADTPPEKSSHDCNLVNWKKRDPWFEDPNVQNQLISWHQTKCLKKKGWRVIAPVQEFREMRNYVSTNVIRYGGKWYFLITDE